MKEKIKTIKIVSENGYKYTLEVTSVKVFRRMLGKDIFMRCKIISTNNKDYPLEEDYWMEINEVSGHYLWNNTKRVHDVKYEKVYSLFDKIKMFLGRKVSET